MAINAYTGIMGSGKSFEVTANVVLPAVKEGRRVVTNIDGISEEKIYAYLLKEHKNLDDLSFGKIIHVTDDDLKKSGFFPDEKKPEIVSLVQPGDLVVIDEAWRHWNRDKKLSDEHMQFFRMHRHYVHPETGICCDLALIFQSISDVHRSVRAVIEMTVRTLKIKTLGLSRTYRLELFEGDKITKTSRFSRKVMNYNKDIFPLYKSYSGTSGKEVVVDKRQNVLRNPVIWITAVGLLILSFFCLRFLNKFFKGEMISASKNVTHSSNNLVPAKVPLAASLPNAGTDIAVVSSTLKLNIVGEVVLRNERWVVLSDEFGRLRLENPSAFVGRGSMMVGHVAGQPVAPWSGKPILGLKSLGD